MDMMDKPSTWGVKIQYKNALDENAVWNEHRYIQECKEQDLNLCQTPETDFTALDIRLLSVEKITS